MHLSLPTLLLHRLQRRIFTTSNYRHRFHFLIWRCMLLIVLASSSSGTIFRARGVGSCYGRAFVSFAGSPSSTLAAFGAGQGGSKCHCLRPRGRTVPSTSILSRRFSSLSPSFDAAPHVETAADEAPTGSPQNGAAMTSTTTTSITSSTSNNAAMKTTTTPTKAAKRVSASPASLSQCGARLRSGHLVSFPTETVYGLGCHALDPTAVKRVFEAKERPYTDPLIVHVTQAEAALKLWRTSGGGGAEQKELQLRDSVLRTLTASFWPGPLTLVAPADPDLVPSLVTADTGYVACRSPSHPVARALIDAAEVPVAAPSANKFGHVSPTRPDHVLDDLGMEDVWVVDPFMTDNGNNDVGEREGDGSAAVEVATAAVCDVGVESTVAKVETAPSPAAAQGTITVLRHGAVSSDDIRRCLETAGMSDAFDVTDVVRCTSEAVANVAPGQTVKHYSPHVVSYMIAHDRYNAASGVVGGVNGGVGTMRLSDEERDLLSRAVVIDFGARLRSLESHALAYRDLSPEGDSSEAASTVFDALRWSEGVAGAERVYFPELSVTSDEAGTIHKSESLDVSVGASLTRQNADALTLAVKDRLTRAASGIVIETLR